jgi:hypothetical protein
MSSLLPLTHFLSLSISNADDGIGAADAPPRAINDVPVRHEDSPVFFALLTVHLVA